MAGKPNENDRSRTRRRSRYFVGLVAGLLAVSAIIIAGPAGAQVVDGELIVKVVVHNGLGGNAESSDFAYTVDSDPTPINWPLNGIVALILDASVPHTVTAVPFAGYTDTTSGCTNVTVDPVTPQLCVITFTFIEPTSSPLTVTKAGTGTGTVHSAPVGIFCGHACSASFANGTTVTLGAIPATGSTFTGWSGGGCSGTGTCVVTLTAATTVTATFTATTAGAFVIGDKSAGNLTVGTKVNFWGAQWWKNNVLSGGKAPAALNGFTNNPATAACGVDWSTRPGNSASPPATLPSQIVVIVTSKATKSGSTISGNTVHVVLVNVGPGYGPDPGHAGNGTIAATIC